jgi:hypothetical protein
MLSDVTHSRTTVVTGGFETILRIDKWDAFVFMRNVDSVYRLQKSSTEFATANCKSSDEDLPCSTKLLQDNKPRIQEPRCTGRSVPAGPPDSSGSFAGCGLARYRRTAWQCPQVTTVCVSRLGTTRTLVPLAPGTSRESHLLHIFRFILIASKGSVTRRPICFMQPT